MSSSMDFLRAPRTPVAGWVLLALGIAAALGALALGHRWSIEREHIERQEEHRKSLQREQLAAASRPVAPTLAQRRWEQAQPELRRPWLPALRAIEAATVNPIFLLSLSIEPSKGLIRLDGEAPSFDYALSYVQILEQDGVLTPATLLSHDSSMSVNGGISAVKFSATTHWVNR